MKPRCIAHCPVEWLEMSPRLLVARMKALGLAIHAERLALRDALGRDDSLAVAAHRVRLDDLHARWEDLT